MLRHKQISRIVCPARLRAMNMLRKMEIGVVLKLFKESITLFSRTDFCGQKVVQAEVGQKGS